jgi:hypothetical protein
MLRFSALYEIEGPLAGNIQNLTLPEIIDKTFKVCYIAPILRRCVMNLRKEFLLLSIAVFFVFLSTGLVFSQEDVTSGPEANTLLEDEMQWVWGEVVFVDAANKNINVKYLDYESDTEKEMVVKVDDKTTYENVKSIEEIKPKDTLSIDYVVTPDGKNLAKNINAEKPEDAQGVQPEEPGAGTGESTATTGGGGNSANTGTPQ